MFKSLQTNGYFGPRISDSSGHGRALQFQQDCSVEIEPFLLVIIIHFR